MGRRQRTLKPKLAVEAWLRRALIDLHLAFVHSEQLNYRVFFLQQGLEKLCKAFLIGTQALKCEHVESNKATKWIDDFSRKFGHDLHHLLGLVSVGIKGLEPWIEDEQLIDILNRGYEEGRYPIPIGKSIWLKHGFPAFASSDLDDKALQLATALWDGVVQYFKERREVISIPLQHPLNDGVDPDYWKRFMAIWHMRSGQALAKQLTAVS